MTTWAVSVADTFFNELLNLPQGISKKVSRVVKILGQDPISAQGDAKKLKGYTNNIYRVRIGDYRLFYSFGEGWVKLLSIRKVLVYKFHSRDAVGHRSFEQNPFRERRGDEYAVDNI